MVRPGVREVIKKSQNGAKRMPILQNIPVLVFAPYFERLQSRETGSGCYLHPFAFLHI